MSEIYIQKVKTQDIDLEGGSFMFIPNQLIIIFIMISVFLTVVSTCKITKQNDSKLLAVGLMCAIIVGALLLLFDVSLTCVAIVLS